MYTKKRKLRNGTSMKTRIKQLGPVLLRTPHIQSL